MLHHWSERRGLSLLENPVLMCSSILFNNKRMCRQHALNSHSFTFTYASCNFCAFWRTLMKLHFPWCISATSVTWTKVRGLNAASELTVCVYEWVSEQAVYNHGSCVRPLLFLFFLHVCYSPCKSVLSRGLRQSCIKREGLSHSGGSAGSILWPGKISILYYRCFPSR